MTTMPVGEDVFAVGKRVYARALRLSDLPHLSAWAADPRLEEMVGSELFTQFTEVYRRSPAFLDALRAELGEERYRAAPLLRRRLALGGDLIRA